MRTTPFPLPLLLLWALAAAAGCQDDLVVRTSLGSVRGSILQSRKGRRIFSFRGVRFAKPPLGPLRFQAPQPLEPWTGIVNATDDVSACLQPSGGPPLPMSEDCLFLNVYTTKLPCKNFDNPNRPVLFFIHPGGWYESTGLSTVFGPQYLMDEDIVLVVPNYRLGALGLLSTGDGVLRGNYALKDQVAALRWVNKNIHAFGGDPSSVTIAGYSVGGVSVIFNMVSPMTKGLFHKAIAMSSSFDTAWDIDRDPIQIAKRHAKLIGCPTETSQEIADCMRQKPADEIIKSFTELLEWGDDPLLVYYPVIEPDFGDGSERYLVKDPYEQLLSGNFTKVPMMTGFTKDEFAWRAFTVLDNSTLTNQMTEDFNYVAPIAFMYERDTELSHYVSQELKKYYLHNQPITNASLDGLGKLYADAIVCFGEDRAAKIISTISKCPVYFYRFAYQGRYSFFYIPNTNIPYGVTHHDDLLYLFYVSLLQIPLFQDTDPEIVTVERYTKMWADFVRTGNPTPVKSALLDNIVWTPMKPNKLTYLDINTKLELKEGVYQERMKMWEKLFPF